MGVDEAGRNDLAAGVDLLAGGRAVESTDVDNAVAFDGQVGREARVAGAVGDPAAADHGDRATLTHSGHVAIVA